MIVKPAVDWPTRVARAVLPKSVSRTDAVYNIGRAALVVDALRCGDLELLQKVMDDRIHQPYRLKHIVGGMSAYKVAQRFGAAALSGAGPSIIAFVPPEKAEQTKTEVMWAFEEQGNYCTRNYHQAKYEGRVSSVAGIKWKAKKQALLSVKDHKACFYYFFFVVLFFFDFGFATAPAFTGAEAPTATGSS